MSDTRGPTAKELFGSSRTPDAALGTRDRLVDTALNLFYEHGFHDVGLDRVLSEVGTTKTTFYKYFESKDELAVAAIERRSAWEGDVFLRAIASRAGDEPRAVLLAVFDVLDEWFREPSYLGCLFINACNAFPNPNDPIHRAAAGHWARDATFIRDMAQRAGVDDPDALASEWIILLQGAFSVRLMTGNDEAALHARRVAERILDQRLGDRP